MLSVVFEAFINYQINTEHKKVNGGADIMTHAFNTSTQAQANLNEPKTSLIYIVSSRSVRAR